MAFNKPQGEHEIAVLKLNHSFALKMASIISSAAVAIIILLSVCFTAVLTPIIGVIIFVVAILFGIVVFSSVRGACL